MKYPNIKSVKLTHDQISQAFGFANRKSFDRTSAHRRYMAGVEKILELVKEERLKQTLIEAGKKVVEDARNFKWEESKKSNKEPEYYPNPK